MTVLQANTYFQRYRSDPLWMKISVRVVSSRYTFALNQLCFSLGFRHMPPRHIASLFFCSHDVLLSCRQLWKSQSCYRDHLVRAFVAFLSSLH